MKKMLNILILLLSLPIQSLAQENAQSQSANKVQFTILSLNVALLALTAKLPEISIPEVKVKTPKVGVGGKKILGVKIPKVKIPSKQIKVPETKVGGTTKLKEVGHLQNNQARANAIAQTIKGLAQQGKVPNIILLQEAFDINVVKNLYEQLRGMYYPYNIRDVRAGRVGVGIKGKKIAELPVGANSGLAIFSQFPIKNTVEKDYSCFAGEGAFARKGILGAEIDIKGRAIYLFNTHLQAGLGSGSFQKLEQSGLLVKGSCVLDGKLVDTNKQPLTTDEIRRAELEQAKGIIESFAANKNAPIIFGGDLNIDVGSQGDIEKVFPQANILFNPAKSKARGTVWDVKNKTVEPKRIDWLLILRNPDNRLSGDAWIENWFGPQHTDHLGYVGEFTLKVQ